MTDGSGDDTDEADRLTAGLEEARMSAAHRTGLAKLPNVIEWLTHAMGGAAKNRSVTLFGR